MERVTWRTVLRLRARSLRRGLHGAPEERTSREWFEDAYSGAADPWRYESSPYEREKYQRSLEALGDRRFARALEIGCSIGVFTELLCPRCDELIGVDISQSAVERARERLAGHPGVSIERRTLPEELPDGRYDLVVASEVLYYWTRDQLTAGLRTIEERLLPGGLLLAVHWRPREDTPLTGDQVHRLLRRNSNLRRLTSVRNPTYRLDVLEKPG